MNLESNSSNKPKVIPASDDIDFDFRPITSGLGFHSQKTTEIKPVFSENLSIPQVRPVVRQQQQVYQNELSMFYGRDNTFQEPVEQIKEDKIIRNATKSQRVLAFIIDLSFVLSCLGIVLTVMARLIERDLLEVWSAYPNEITPMVVVLFTGFFLIYFSIYDKTFQSTLGKNLLSIRVVDLDNKAPSFTMLMFRSSIMLANFVSLGLFSYFDLQNKVANTKVIKAE